MKRSIVSLLFFCLVICSVCLAAKVAGKVTPFDPQAWETSYAAAYEQRDPSLLREHISMLFNVAGASREDLIKRADSEFKKYARVACSYRVLEVRPSDGDDHTVVKARVLVKATPVGKTDSVTLSEGDSYDSLVFEEGRWKMYDTVAINGAIAKANAIARIPGASPLSTRRCITTWASPRARCSRIQSGYFGNSNRSTFVIA